MSKHVIFAASSPTYPARVVLQWCSLVPSRPLMYTYHQNPFRSQLENPLLPERSHTQSFFYEFQYPLTDGYSHLGDIQ